MSADGKKPQDHLQSVTKGYVKDTKSVRETKAKQRSPDTNWALGVCRVAEINYEEFAVSLRVVSGKGLEQMQAPIPLTFPAAGARHFLGAMPQLGDLCVVGWMPHESGTDKSPKGTAVILGWLINGTWVGRDWATTAEYSTEEHDQGMPKDRAMMRGHDRVRHKLRHVQPGEIVASSAQGSDLVLDEGVTLSNRRGNEIRLRDQDQAFVVRSSQQFHAMSGSRIYAGMVQRDATFLPPAMVSDGKQWDHTNQATNREPQHEVFLPNSDDPEGLLTPAAPWARTKHPDGLNSSLIQPEHNIDPYHVLQRGGFINEVGHVVDSLHASSAMYGGKPFFRVAADSRSNTVIDPAARTLTEWRLELAHSSDGRLPVTEQTDMFDAERLPRSTPDTADSDGLSGNEPYIEYVMGSVVGNDPRSKHGRPMYGKPLVAVVFDGDEPNPRMEPARLTAKGDAQSATPISEHAATLFRLSPLVDKAKGGVRDTFWSVNKSGQVRMSISGAPDAFSVEAALVGGLKLDIGGDFDLRLNGPIKLRSGAGSPADNVGLHLGSDTGAVHIFGGGGAQGAEASAARLSGNPSTDADTPAVHVQGATNVRLEAGRQVQIQGQKADIAANHIQLQAMQVIDLAASDKITTSAKVVTQAYGGKHTEMYAGPLDGLPTNGALHETTYAPQPLTPVAVKTTIVRGDRQEDLQTGDHFTTLGTGNATWEAKAGSFTAIGASSDLKISSDGIVGNAKAGPITLKAVAGSATLSGQTSVRIDTQGQATVQGTAGITLGTIVDNNQGAVICGGTLEPLSGLPFSTWGLGAQRVRIEAAV